MSSRQRPPHPPGLARVHLAQLLAPLIGLLRGVVRFAGTLGELAQDEEASVAWRDFIS